MVKKKEIDEALDEDYIEGHLENTGDEYEVEEDEDEDDGSREIDLDEEDEEEEDDGQTTPSNHAFAEMRKKNKELEDEINKLKQTKPLAPVQPVQQAPQQPAQPTYAPDDGIPRTDAEWDALAKADWKKAVDLRSKQNAQSLLEEQVKTESSNRTLLESKQKVLARHPELNDVQSEKSQILLKILEQNPDYASHPRGPLWAMRDMEEYMQDVLGKAPDEIVSAERRGRQKEAMRQSRVVLQSTGGRSTGTSTNVVKLSKDELEFCKHNGVDPKEFARNKRQLESSGRGRVQL